jgi:hypothetical protein
LETRREKNAERRHPRYQYGFGELCANELQCYCLAKEGSSERTKAMHTKELQNIVWRFFRIMDVLDSSRRNLKRRNKDKHRKRERI